ncbi:MAG: ABC transporter ATP-binding protein [Proteobacteria bacterium]|nr:ABC transporter ATP-binding protein [Pseudomonadota bacterium]
MSDPVIKTTDLTKEYHLGDNVVRALRGVSIDIAPGEFVAIMGQSGSGKSTMMNLLGGLDTPTSGSYFLEGIDVSSLSADELAQTRNRKIGFVFQSFNLLARTSALENVQLPLLYSPTPKAERLKRAEQVLTDVGLAERMDHHPSQLSGGQQQRVAIARALVNRPALILADEPTGALDTRTGLEIMAIFQGLNRSGMTVVIVTHEPEVARFAGHTIRFQDGLVVDQQRIAEPADAAALLATEPARKEVAA